MSVSTKAQYVNWGYRKTQLGSNNDNKISPFQDVTYNICDQKFHEFEIRSQCPDVYVVRKTLTQIAETGTLTKVR